MEDSFKYSDSIKDAIISELVSKVVGSISKLLFTKSKNNNLSINAPNFEDSILNHFNEIYNWCKNLEFIGLGGRPLSTLTKSIELEYSYSLKSKYSFELETETILPESEFIFSESNVIIVGDPGSGKTTSLKRILYRYFLDLEKPESPYNFPILVRFRSIEDGFDIFTYIASLLGINYETREETYKTPIQKSGNKKIKSGSISKTIEYTYNRLEKRKRTIYLVDEVPLDIALIKLFETNSVLLIMDGWDELQPELFESLKKQIEKLSLNLCKSKIILTSRPNYIDFAYSNFSLYEVNPLTPTQVNTISQLWLSDSDVFLKELSEKSYFELVNRPLFLSFLILLYKANQAKKKNALPKFSRDVYEQIIELLLSKWDKDRDIERQSRYAEFDEKKKLKFLSHIAFKLTYITKTKIFSHTELEQAYLLTYKYFDLPKNESSMVALELENHTGIITKSLYDKYEFSHLAIQEYLCALYILGAPFDQKINDYLLQYPAPLAFAVALSSDSSLWLSELIKKMLSSEINVTRVATNILTRVTIEAPYFENKKQVISSLMLLCNRIYPTDFNFTNALNNFIKLDNEIEKEFLLILEDYHQKEIINQRFLFRRKIISLEDYPTQVYLPLGLYFLNKESK